MTQNMNLPVRTCNPDYQFKSQEEWEFYIKMERHATTVKVLEIKKQESICKRIKFIVE